MCAESLQRPQEVGQITTHGLPTFRDGRFPFPLAEYEKSEHIIPGDKLWSESATTFKGTGYFSAPRAGDSRGVGLDA